MRNVVGTPARDLNFFRRDSEIEKIKDRLSAGNNLQIAAPRRVGKTSILFYLQDNAVNDNTYIYVDTESIDNENEFYKKLLKEIVGTDSIAKSGKLRGLFKDGANSLLKKIKCLTILGNGIEFKDHGNPDYREELTNFLTAFETDGDRTLVLLIDEFPQTVLNIVEAHSGDTRAAVKFLQSNRELRLNPVISRKVRFVYTGSIGLNHTVASIKASAFVNDLNTVEIAPLSPVAARAFVAELLTERKIVMEQEAIDYLLGQIHWLIPFHIQLAMQEINDICRTTGIAMAKDIDQAFLRMIANKNHSHFEHYHSRLRIQFKNGSLKYAEAVLEAVAGAESLPKSSIYGLAVTNGMVENYRQVLGILEYDGYINYSPGNDTYQFNSPVVRLWWQRYICK